VLGEEFDAPALKLRRGLPFGVAGVSMRIAIVPLVEPLSADSTTSNPRGREDTRREANHKGDKVADVGPAVTVTLSASALAQARALDEEDEAGGLGAPAAEALVSPENDDGGTVSSEARPTAPSPPATAVPSDSVAAPARRPKALFRFAKTTRSSAPPSAVKRASSKPAPRAGRFRAWSSTRSGRGPG
jgi:hypothetical protein